MALPIIMTAIVPTPYNQRTDEPRCALHHLSTSTPRPRMHRALKRHNHRIATESFDSPPVL
jgi:hypothetical protein